MEQSINSFQKGMNSDFDKSLQPKNTSSFILNGNLETKEGDSYSLSNDKGNQTSVDLTDLGEGLIIIGQCNIGNNERFLIVTNNYNETPDSTAKGYFLIVDDSGNKTVLLEDTYALTNFSLNLNIHYPIDCTFRIREGCNRTVYMTDQYNSIRVFDIDERDQYYDSSNNLVVSKLSLFRDFEQSCISLDKVLNSGGSLELGVYQFAIQYLDDDLNPTPFHSITNPIPITSGNYNGDYNVVEGGNPAIELKTNKSIKLNITDLDQNFSYYRIAVIATIASSTNVYLKTPIEIHSSTSTYNFTGIDVTNDSISSLADVTASKINYLAKHIDQTDNRLIIANLKDKIIDYSVFQREALNITSKYITKIHQAKNSSNDSYSPKSAKYYNDLRSYMRDEIYAFAIVWQLTDGTETPPFHIPGRVAINSSSLKLTGNSNAHNRPPAGTNNWDKEILVALPTHPDLQHLPTQTLVPRWKAYNTAIRTYTNPSNSSIEAGDIYTSGEMAYYESELLYPTTTDCSGNNIYGSLAGTPILHHKFPDTTLEPHFIMGEVDGSSALNTNIFPSSDKIVSLGIQFNNIIPPAQYSDIISGYKIVRAKREFNNKTVLDKGFIFPNANLANSIVQRNINDFSGTIQSYPYYKHLAPSVSNLYYNIPYDVVEAGGSPLCAAPNGPFAKESNLTKSFSFHSPVTKFSSIDTAHYLKIERELRGNVSNYDLDNGTGGIYIYRERLDFKDSQYPQTNPLITTNRVITNQKKIEPYERVSSDLSNIFFNENQQETYVIELEDEIPDPTYIEFVGADNYGGSPPYLRVSTGATAISYYSALKNYNPQMYGDLANIIYYDTHYCSRDKSNTSIDLYQGDTFISSITVPRSFKGSYATLCSFTPIEYWEEGSIVTLYCESEINSELRHEFFEDEEDIYQGGYYPKTYNDTKNNVPDYLRRLTGLPTVIVNDKVYTNTYFYNLDYSKINEIKAYFPIPSNYNYCTKCLNSYKTRVAASNKSYQQERVDNYRSFLFNNYTDIPSSTGEITNIFVKENKLYYKTERSLFVQQVKPQQAIQTIEAPLYIGTGEIFSIEPYQITNGENGFAGGYAKFGDISTPYGQLIISEKQKSIFLLTSSLEEISSNGQHKFFKENLSLFYYDQLKKLTSTNSLLEGLFYFQDNVYSPKSVGFTACYDPNNKRIIITKKDYKLINEDKLIGYTLNDNEFKLLDGTVIGYKDEVLNDVYLWDDTNKQYAYVLSNVLYYPSFDDVTHYENKSFTIAFHLQEKVWISYYSYLPRLLYSDNNDFYSTLNDGKIYIHNSNVYNNYYGIQYPFIVESVLTKDNVSKNTTNAIKWSSISKKYNTSNKEFYEDLDDTFDQCIIYNDYQSTLLQTILDKKSNPYSTITNNAPIIIYADRYNKLWSISEYRNFVDDTVNESFFSKNWSSIIASGFLYYIDKVPNSNKLNSTKNIYQRDRLSDRYICARMIYNKSNKLSTNFILSNLESTIK